MKRSLRSVETFLGALGQALGTQLRCTPCDVQQLRAALLSLTAESPGQGWNAAQPRFDLPVLTLLGGGPASSALFDLLPAPESTEVWRTAMEAVLLAEGGESSLYRRVLAAWEALVDPLIDEGVVREGQDREDLTPFTDAEIERRVREVCATVRARLLSEGRTTRLTAPELEGVVSSLLGEARQGRRDLGGALQTLLEACGAGEAWLVMQLAQAYFQLEMEVEKRGQGWLDVFRDDAAAGAEKAFEWTDWRMLDVLTRYTTHAHGDRMHDPVLREVARAVAGHACRPVRTLVIGAGEGRLPIDIALQEGPRVEIHSTDYVAGNVAYAHAQYVLRKVPQIASSQPANVANLSAYADGTVDLVASSGALRYFVTEVGGQAARELRRVLAPHGTILFQDALKPTWAYLTERFRERLEAAGLATEVMAEALPVKNISVTYKLIQHLERARPGSYDLAVKAAAEALVAEGYAEDARDAIGRATGNRVETIRLVRAWHPESPPR